jgi:putative phosphoesterase
MTIIASAAVIGVISDTHGLLRPCALAGLRGADLILHAGDIGRPGVLEDLAALAPVVAVRGNVDQGPWADALPEAETVQFGGTGGLDDAGGPRLLLLHDIARLPAFLPAGPAAARVSVVVSGHSHIPAVVRRDGVLYLNPGSAGPRRFSLPVTLALLEVRAGAAEARIIGLEA